MHRARECLISQQNAWTYYLLATSFSCSKRNLPVNWMKWTHSTARKTHNFKQSPPNQLLAERLACMSKFCASHDLWFRFFFHSSVSFSSNLMCCMLLDASVLSLVSSHSRLFAGLVWTTDLTRGWQRFEILKFVSHCTQCFFFFFKFFMFLWTRILSSSLNFRFDVFPTCKDIILVVTLPTRLIVTRLFLLTVHAHEKEKRFIYCFHETCWVAFFL